MGVGVPLQLRRNCVQVQELFKRLNCVQVQELFKRLNAILEEFLNLNATASQFPPLCAARAPLIRWG